MDGRSPSVFQRGSLCCHCLLLETGQGLVLVDTGFGMQDVLDPASRISGFFLRLLCPDFREEMTAVRQVERLGFRAQEVRHIVLTHLDFDHAGGLDDFPWARVHLMCAERDAAAAQRTWLDRQRFRPQQWSTRAQWVVYDSRPGDGWNGFDCVRGLFELPPEILLVPLLGHTLGHAGVAVRADTGWMLMAGDAYFNHAEMSATPWCTPGLRLYQALMEKDRRARLHNQERLRALVQRAGTGLQVMCAHDPHEFEAASGRPAGAAIDPLRAPRRPA